MTISRSLHLLDPRSLLAARLLTDPQAGHVFTMTVLPKMVEANPREQGNLLWHVGKSGNRPTLTVQSTHPGVDHRRLSQAEGVQHSEQDTDLLGTLGSRLDAGTHLRFMLRANPTRAVSVQGKRGKRAPLLDEQEIIDWLERQAHGAFALAQVDFGGGEMPDVSIEHEDVARPRRGPSSPTLNSVLIKGSLVVQSREKMEQVLTSGVGRGKAFGFGLLQVA